jgi:murein DD-endopeptidase MepM/ murein hydrolase activator NlpD
MNSIFGHKFAIPIRRKVLSWTISEGAKGHYRLKPGVFTVGRLTSNNIVIDQDSVSRRHAQISLEKEGLFIEDLASTRGTWIGSTRLKPYTRTLVPAGESIWIGEVEVTYDEVQTKQVPILWIAGGAVPFLLLVGVIAFFLFRIPPTPPPFVCPVSSYSISLSELAQPTQAPPPTSPPSTLQSSTLISETSPTALPEITPTQESTVLNTDQFLDLPFPYDGTNVCKLGTEEQFLKASQHYSQGGRINSFFDHDLPIYTLETPTINKTILLYTGEENGQVWYSGHNGYDFSIVELNNTAVCAAASGTVEAAGPDPELGNLVQIKHNVNGLTYFTLYGHLLDDAYFKNTESLVGQDINIYTRVGTMGNTGAGSHGDHLHFQVSIDNIYSVVDPYGYIPSTDHPGDPSTPASNYLWIHPIPNNLVTFSFGNVKKSDQPAGAGGAAMVLPHICAPPDALPGGGKLFFSLSLSPPPASGLVSIGKAVTFTIQDQQDKMLDKFSKSIHLTLPYVSEDLNNIEPGSTLQVRRLNQEKNAWEFIAYSPIKAYSYWYEADFNIDLPGQYALFGSPIKAIIPPQTIITASGLRSSSGVWCSVVSVKISVQDNPNSPPGVQDDIRYSFGNNEYWTVQKYDGPITRDLQPNGKPANLLPSIQDPYPSGIGRFLVQGITKDSTGNAADNPTVLYIVIDPMININQCVDTTVQSK